jgi:peptidoglycan LD-endopeptidase LytH
MALTAAQTQTARLITGLARRAGISPARAREVVAAAYAESTLNPRATNKSSGAAGLFQLLSSGYVNQANKLGGVYNPRANTQAIINDYARYWKQHPGAAPGEAGRDVERSGAGAGFYANPLSLLGNYGGGAVPAAAAPAGGGGLVAPPPAPAGPSFRPSAQLLASLQMPVQALGASSVTPDMRVKIARFVAGKPTPTPRSQVAAADTPAPVNDPKTGNWVDPVSGKVIGTPYAGTHTLGNWESDRALDIAVPIGTPVRSPFGGVVGSQFGSLGSSGRFQGLRLHVASPANEWYGAHLSRYAPGIKPGVRVRPGQVVGYSGSASGVAHLHEALRSGDPYHLIR